MRTTPLSNTKIDIFYYTAITSRTHVVGTQPVTDGSKALGRRHLLSGPNGGPQIRSLAERRQRDRDRDLPHLMFCIVKYCQCIIPSGVSPADGRAPKLRSRYQCGRHAPTCAPRFYLFPPSLPPTRSRVDVIVGPHTLSAHSTLWDPRSDICT